MCHVCIAMSPASGASSSRATMAAAVAVPVAAAAVEHPQDFPLPTYTPAPPASSIPQPHHHALSPPTIYYKAHPWVTRRLPATGTGMGTGAGVPVPVLGDMGF